MAIKRNFIKRIKKIIDLGQRKVLLKVENDKNALIYYTATIYNKKNGSGFKLIRRSRITRKEAMSYL